MGLKRRRTTVAADLALGIISCAAGRVDASPIRRIELLCRRACDADLLFFMQLRYQRGLVRIFALAGFFWLAIAGVLTFADYLTCGWLM